MAAGLSVAVAKAFQGVSPTLVAELCDRACVSATVPVEVIESQAWDRLYGAWLHWLQLLQEGGFTATQDGSTGRISFLGSYGEDVPGGVQTGLAMLIPPDDQA